jgi:hypothetical protein
LADHRLWYVILITFNQAPELIHIGGMDDTMTSILKGEVVGFRAIDKKVALILGCGISVASLIGTIAIVIWLILR